MAQSKDTVLSILDSTLNTDEHGDELELLREHLSTNDFEVAVGKLASDSVTAKKALLVNDLLQISGHDKKLVATIASTDSSSLRDVAVAIPHEVPKILASNLMERESSGIAQGILERATLPSVDNDVQATAATVLSDAVSFDISSHRVSALAGLDQPVTDLLGDIQRIQNIAPSPDVIPHLVDAGLTSAARISSLPVSTFVESVPGIDVLTAQEIHKNAQGVTHRNEMILASISPSIASNNIALAAAATSTAPSSSIDPSNQLNLDTIFGDAFITTCDDCSSVLSPSAYLVDLLQFLPDAARIELLRRRPDIQHLELSCSNTKKEIPYLDLVNEILESFLATKSTATNPDIQPFNTSEDQTSAELIAEPQNVNLLAYDPLRTALTPIGVLPFEKHLFQTQALLQNLGTSRIELMDTFGIITVNDTSGEISQIGLRDAEILRIPEAEYLAITGQTLSSEAGTPLEIAKHWGYSSVEEMLDGVTGISKIKSQFLRRTGYKFTDVVDLLKAKYVNPAVPDILLKAKKSLKDLRAMIRPESEDIWGLLLHELKIDRESKVALQIIEFFENIPYTATIGEYRYLRPNLFWDPHFTTPNFTKFYMPGWIEYIADGAQYGTWVGYLTEWGAVYRSPSDSKSNPKNPPIGWFDENGILYYHVSSDENNVNGELDIPMYQKPEYQTLPGTPAAGQMGTFWVKSPDQGSPRAIKILRKPNASGQIFEFAPTVTSEILQKYGRSIPQYGWNFPPFDERLSIRTVDDAPLPVEKWSDLNKFVRLQKRLGWTIKELDQAIEVFGGKINTDLLHQLANLEELRSILGLPLSKMLVFWSNMSMDLYKTMFLKSSVLRTDPLLNLTSSLDEPVFTTRTEPLAQHLQGLSAGLGISQSSLAQILSALEMEPESTTLNMDVLSSIYRTSLTCRALSQPFAQLSSLSTIFGTYPYENVQKTLEFFKFWTDFFSKSDATPSQIEYLMIGFDRFGNLAPKLLSSLESAYTITQLNTESRSVDQIASILSGSFDFITPALAKMLIPGNLDELSKNSPVIDAQFDGYLIPSQSMTTTIISSPAPDPSLSSSINFGIPLQLIGGQFYRAQGANLRWEIQQAIPEPIPQASMLAETVVLSVQAALAKLARYDALGPLLNFPINEMEHLVQISQSLSLPNELLFPDLQTLVQLHDIKSGITSLPALTNILVNPDFATVTDAAEKISSLMSWKTPVTSTLLSKLWASQSSSESIHVDMSLLHKLLTAYRIFEKVRVSDLLLIFNWANPMRDIAQTAAEVRTALKGRMDEETWESKAAVLFDPIRRVSRDALLAATLNVMTDVPDADALFEFFLIDPSMGTCLRTSRIKQALSSVQILVQRILLGLEPSLDASTIHLDQATWEWKRSYDTWRANRLVFLYPENWMEPSLRDDKSVVFKEVQSLIEQGQATNEGILDKYIAGASVISNLEPVALYSGPKRDHIYSRTRSAPHKFYYQFLDRNTGCWSSYQPIDIDIPTIQLTRTYATEPLGYFVKYNRVTTQIDVDAYIRDNPDRSVGSGSHIYPFIKDGKDERPIMIIPTFLEKSCKVSSDPKDPTVRYWWQVGLMVSELKDGKWTPLRASPSSVNSRSASDETPITNSQYKEKLNWMDPDENHRRLPLFICMPYSNSEGNIGIKIFSGGVTPLYTLKSVNTLPAYVPSRPTVRGMFLGEFVYEGDNLYLREPRMNDTFDRPIYDEITIRRGLLFNADFRSLGNRVDERTLSVRDTQLLPAGSPRLQESIPSFSSAESSGDNHAPRNRVFFWGKNQNPGDLPVQVSNTFISQFQRLAANGDYHGIFDVFSDDPTWEKTWGVTPNATTVLDQALGNRNVLEPISVYHELHTPSAIYNWELCVHIPMLLADHYLQAEQLDKALASVKYVFDPTSTDRSRIWKFWVFRHVATKGVLASAIGDQNAVKEWTDNPFDPFVIARSRPSAIMKWFAYKYVEIMILKGDLHFRRYTLEDVNLAIQCYVEASHVFGPRPQLIPAMGKKETQTFASISSSGKKWTEFSNVLVQMEMLFPFRNSSTRNTSTPQAGGAPPQINIFGTSTTNLFSTPSNPALVLLRDRIDDRLYKLRHCQDIDGNMRSLSLWELPLDPGALIRAYASGGGIGSYLESPRSFLPNFRFNSLLSNALKLCGEVKTLGSTLLLLREKKDLGHLSNLQVTQQSSINNLMMDIKKQKLEELNEEMKLHVGGRQQFESKMKHQLAWLGKGEDVMPAVDADYIPMPPGISKRSMWGKSPLSNLELSSNVLAITGAYLSTATAIVQFAAGLIHLVPDEYFVLAPAGVGTMSWGLGGSKTADAMKTAAEAAKTEAEAITWVADYTAKMADLERQSEERILDANQTGFDITTFDVLIRMQNVKIKQANKEIEIMQKTIDNATEMEKFLKSKYTSVELYSWVINSLQRLYSQTYNLAFDIGRQAEQAFCFERGISSSNIIEGGYWNTTRDGLLAGEQLSLALYRLQQAHSTSRGHDFEITRNISLRRVNPLALALLRSESSTGSFELPEMLFDMDFPGHYNRRIRSVQVSIVCEVEPYASVNATLKLLAHRYRISNTLVGSEYLEDFSSGMVDDRFRNVDVPTSVIALCTAQLDAGVFQLNFQDERYMPFENAGVISKWQLDLNPLIKSFDYASISDVILQINYTSKNGGPDLLNAANLSIKNFLKDTENISLERGLSLIIDPRLDAPNAWNNFKTTGTLAIPGTTLRERLPFFAQSLTATVQKVALVVEFTSDAAGKSLSLEIGSNNDTLPIPSDTGNTGVGVGVLKTDVVGSWAVVWKPGAVPVEWKIGVTGAANLMAVVGGIISVQVVAVYSVKLG